VDRWIDGFDFLVWFLRFVVDWLRDVWLLPVLVLVLVLGSSVVYLPSYCIAACVLRTWSLGSD
jgi:hypothetical protein